MSEDHRRFSLEFKRENMGSESFVFTGRLSETPLPVLCNSVQRGWAHRSDRIPRQIQTGLGRKVDAPVRGRPGTTAEDEDGGVQTGSL